ncbi:HTTM domain-containing protein [Dokdonia sinensis]|uniref:HTTM domain-containing protein n=1 Tax=Dokdonia sinensis TaxID=2479847 RepID=A0A3M0GF29_9FLAO|nr:HTTM domain-containing protein [Dokdonia sinensis]RMB63374.1 HTTM domain-containing protein [Dokdonia sinensis]
MLKKLNTYLFARVDNSSLVVFRIIFGFLITAEAWGAIATGWLRRVFVEPEFTFNFIGFDFLQVFPGTGPHMYAYFALMGVFGVMVMVGYKYRFAILGYGVMWSAVYLMQKSSYNNHYYLLMLLCGMMALLPAARNISVDAWKNPAIKRISMPRWVVVLIIIQLWIVYTYGSIAKLYPDWLNATVPQILMKSRADYWLIGDVLQQRWAHYTISYVGILFDGLIIPMLLWRPTRKFAFFISIFFHLFNSIVFQIGIFPYMSLAFTLFFFDAKTIHSIFLKRWKPLYKRSEVVSGAPKSTTASQNIETSIAQTTNTTLQPARVEEVIIPKYKNFWTAILAIYFIFQIGLPLRHWFIEDNVLWTEEGHRLSWRMMLRSKTGSVIFYLEDKATGKREIIPYRDYLSKKQQRNIRSKPDMIWQFAQRLKKQYAAEGKDVAIYVDCKIKVNGRKLRQFIKKDVDLASVPWEFFKHNPWLEDSGVYLLE